MVVVKHLPSTSATSRALHGEASEWSLTDHLLASATDVLRWLQWAKTEDGAANRNQPAPIPRPGVEGPKRIGDASMTFEEVDEWLGWNKPKPTEEGASE